jgi:hypothetical protein
MKGIPMMLMIANRKKKMIAPAMAPTTLTPSQSATRRPDGLPASASRFSVFSVNETELMREAELDNRPTSGRRVRSMNGCWSSSSSRFFA